MGLLIISIIILFFVINHLFLIVKPSFNVINYNGVPRDSYGSVPHWWTNQKMISSNTFTIGDYKVVTTKYDLYATKYCKSIPKNHNANSNTDCANIGDWHSHPRVRSCTFLNETKDEHNCTVQTYKCSGYSRTYECGCYNNAGCGSCDCENPYYNKIVTYGGQTISTSDASGYANWGCSELVKIYKDNELISTIGESAGNSGTTLHSYTQWNSPDGTLSLGLGSPSQFKDYGCEYVANQIIYNPLGLVNVSVLDKNIKLVKGEDTKIKVLVSNKLDYKIKGDLISKVCAPGFFGTQCKSFNNSLIINPNSNNIITLSVPISKDSNLSIVNTIIVGANIQDLKLSGVNYACAGDGKTHGVGWCLSNGYDYYKFGKVTSKPYNISVVYEPNEPINKPVPSQSFFTNLLSKILDWLNKIFG